MGIDVKTNRGGEVETHGGLREGGFTPPSKKIPGGWDIMR